MEHFRTKCGFCSQPWANSPKFALFLGNIQFLENECCLKPGSVADEEFFVANLSFYKRSRPEQGPVWSGSRIGLSASIVWSWSAPLSGRRPGRTVETAVHRTGPISAISTAEWSLTNHFRFSTKSRWLVTTSTTWTAHSKSLFTFFIAAGQPRILFQVSTLLWLLQCEIVPRRMASTGKLEDVSAWTTKVPFSSVEHYYVLSSVDKFCLTRVHSMSAMLMANANE